MPRKLTYDLLVHPFYSLAFNYDINSAKGGNLRMNARHMSKIWSAHIKAIKDDPHRGLIFIKPDFEIALSGGHLDFVSLSPDGYDRVAMAKRLCSALESFAKKQLGPSRCIVVADPNNLFDTVDSLSLRRNGAVKRRPGLAMGEYYNTCVKNASKFLYRLKGRKVRPSMSRSVSLGGEKMGEFSDIPARTSAVLKRAKNIAWIRARRR